MCISERDIALAAELTLPHRLRRGPFQQTDVNIENIESLIEQIQSDFNSSGENTDPSEGTEEPTDKKKDLQ